MGRRAEALHQEYVDNARRVDSMYGGTEQVTVGPVEEKLFSFEKLQGVVVGAFGEASEPVHRLIDQLATSRVRVTGPQRGRKGVVRSEEGERSMVVSHIRRKISMVAVRAQCLLGGLENLGPGTRLACSS